MKKTMLKLVMSAFLGVSMLMSCGNAQESNDSLTKAEFKVYGNCGMCEKTIEGSLNGQDGIGNADWDRETKMITVSYNPEKMNEDKIKAKIAGVGYDTDSHRADKEVYSELPGCCQYERPE
ncbi:MAG: cation transporter [Flavobacteriales bacterium]|jgi:copper chaperone CopZ|nr:cation transporter [Flavobacteriales bacterium]